MWSMCLPGEIAHRCHSCRLGPRGNRLSCHSHAPPRFPSGRRKWRDQFRRLRWSGALRTRGGGEEGKKRESLLCLLLWNKKDLEHLSWCCFDLFSHHWLQRNAGKLLLQRCWWSGTRILSEHTGEREASLVVDFRKILLKTIVLWSEDKRKKSYLYNNNNIINTKEQMRLFMSRSNYCK